MMRICTAIGDPWNVARDQWGVYAVPFPAVVRTEADLAECFLAVLPDLVEMYHEGKRRRFWPLVRKKKSAEGCDPSRNPPHVQERTSLYHLHESVWMLALDAEDQIAALPEFVVVADDLADELEHWLLVCRRSGCLPDGALRSKLECMDADLAAMAAEDRADLWTREALAEEAEWERIRSEARAAISLPSWPSVVPSIGGA